MEPKDKTTGEDLRTEAEGEDKSPSRPDKEYSRFQDARSESDETNEAAEGKTHPGLKIFGLKLNRFKMALLLGSLALCLLLTIVGFYFVKFRTPVPKASPEIAHAPTIMRPIPLPDYREMLDFLLVYEVEGQKMITAIRMELGYQSSIRYQNFKEQNVAFRDSVYFFMLDQNPSKNSVRSWHSVLEKYLLDFLKVKLPQSYPDKIVLTQVENL